ncbi:MAG: hypothetical protein AB1489_22775 [Acidobacteriota bacterium]
MRKSILIIAAIALTLSFSAVTFAGTKTPRINARQQHQRDRIAQGIRSGELTNRETTALIANQAKIQRDENRAKADGIVTSRERARLHKEENRASKRIYKAKHN